VASDKIIFTGSIEGEAAFPHSTVYSATKAFVHHIGGGLWFEEKENGVDVLTLAPGPTDTNAAALQGIDREQKVSPMSPEKVSEMALAALGKKPLLIPGLSNRLIVRFFRFMPRAKALSLAGKGMVKALTDARGSY
jgi:short-subunit dehydrogenase